MAPLNKTLAHRAAAGVVGLVQALEHSLEAGVALARRDPRLIRERTSLGETALHLLVMGPSLEAVRAILELGAEVDVVSCGGSSPLSLAALHGRPDFVHVLLRAGASITAEGQRQPTLHQA